MTATQLERQLQAAPGTGGQLRQEINPLEAALPRSRVLDASSFDSRHRAALEERADVFHRTRSDFTNYTRACIRQRHMHPTKPTDLRLSSLAMALPGARPSTRAVTAAAAVLKQARKHGTRDQQTSAEHRLAAAVWAEDRERLQLLRTLADEERGPRGSSRGRASLLPQRDSATAYTGQAPRSTLSRATLTGAERSHTASQSLPRVPSDALFDGNTRSLTPSMAGPERDVWISTAEEDAAQQAGLGPPHYASERSAALLESHVHSLSHESAECKLVSATLQLDGGATREGQVLPVPPMPRYMRTTRQQLADHAKLESGAGGGALGTGTGGAPLKLPARARQRALRAKMPAGGQQPRQNVTGASLWSTSKSLRTFTTGQETPPAARTAMQINHMARAVLQARALARAEPNHDRPLDAGFMFAGAWGQLGLDGRPFAPDTMDAVSAAEFSVLAHADAAVHRPPGANQGYLVKQVQELRDHAHQNSSLQRMLLTKGEKPVDLGASYSSAPTAPADSGENAATGGSTLLSATQRCYSATPAPAPSHAPQKAQMLVQVRDVQAMAKASEARIASESDELRRLLQEMDAFECRTPVAVMSCLKVQDIRDATTLLMSEQLERIFKGIGTTVDKAQTHQLLEAARQANMQARIVNIACYAARVRARGEAVIPLAQSPKRVSMSSARAEQLREEGKQLSLTLLEDTNGSQASADTLQQPEEEVPVPTVQTELQDHQRSVALLDDPTHPLYPLQEPPRSPSSWQQWARPNSRARIVKDIVALPDIGKSFRVDSLRADSFRAHLRPSTRMEDTAKDLATMLFNRPGSR